MVIAMVTECVPQCVRHMLVAFGWILYIYIYTLIQRYQRSPVSRHLLHVNRISLQALGRYSDDLAGLSLELCWKRSDERYEWICLGWPSKGDMPRMAYRDQEIPLVIRFFLDHR